MACINLRFVSSYNSELFLFLRIILFHGIFISRNSQIFCRFFWPDNGHCNHINDEGPVYCQVWSFVTYYNCFMVTIMLILICMALLFFPYLLYGTWPLKQEEKARYTSSKLSEADRPRFTRPLKNIRTPPRNNT